MTGLPLTVALIGGGLMLMAIAGWLGGRDGVRRRWMPSWLRWAAPRLTYRISTGHWCDHADQRVSLEWTLGPNGEAGSMVDQGWGPWEMADLGRMKIRHCERCGHMETTLGHPIRDGIATWWRGLSVKLRQCVILTVWCLVAVPLAVLAWHLSVAVAAFCTVLLVFSAGLTAWTAWREIKARP
jgi:hypothetical protein